MYKHEDILIVGDSFCQHRDNVNTWPYRLSCLLTEQALIEKPRGKGNPGASWWSTRKVLLEELSIKVPKVLILCHTEYNRLPSDFDFGLNAVSAEHDYKNFDKKTLYALDQSNKYKDYYSKEIAYAATLYYKYLNSLEYNYWSRNMWFKEIENIVDELQIEKVIHLHGFYDFIKNKGNMFPYMFKNGLTAKEILWEICDDKKQFSPEHVNHFSKLNNTRIADVIYNQLCNYKLGTYNFNF